MLCDSPYCLDCFFDRPTFVAILEELEMMYDKMEPTVHPLDIEILTPAVVVRRTLSPGMMTWSSILHVSATNATH